MIDSVSCLLLTGAQAFSSLPSDALPRLPFTCEGHTTTYEGETVMWRRNSKARLLGILLCLTTVSGGLVTAAGGAALAASSTALPDVTALPASPATTTPPHPGCPHPQPLAAGTYLGHGRINGLRPPGPRGGPQRDPHEIAQATNIAKHISMPLPQRLRAVVHGHWCEIHAGT